METKYVRVPFEVELAKNITKGEAEGRIVTKKGDNVRIVCFDVKGKAPILGLIDKEYREGFQCYDERGKVPAYEYNELDLMLEIPEYMTFKDGDVYTTIRGSVGIYNSNYKTSWDSIPFYVGMRNDGKLIFRKNDDYAGFGSIKESMLSTEEEKQKLIDALKASKEPEAKKCLKILGIEVKQEFEFKPFDKVMVRDGVNDAWQCSLFSNYISEFNGFKYITVTGMYKQCIPYNEQTAHLLGTTENYE